MLLHSPQIAAIPKTPEIAPDAPISITCPLPNM